MNKITNFLTFLTVLVFVVFALIGIQFLCFTKKQPIFPQYTGCLNEQNELCTCEELRLKTIHELQACQEEIIQYRVENALEIKR